MMRSIRTGLTLAISVATVAVAAWLLHLRGDGGRQTRARYTKYEYRIPMRDGLTLFPSSRMGRFFDYGIADGYKFFSAPEPLQPNEVTSVRYVMPDIDHTFLRGHRLVVQVQSAWFPLADLKPQSFVRISDAKSADSVKATQRIFHQPEAAFLLVLPELDR